MKIFPRIKKNSGFTLIELVVVLSIFAVLSTVVIFNYGGFQSKIDLQNLTSQIALQISQAQSSALSGLLSSKISTSWKPAYGVYFSSTSAPDINGADSSDFIYFADVNDNGQFDGSAVGTNCTGDCISKYTITKSDKISDLMVSYINGSITHPANTTISFARPNSGPTIYDGTTLVTSPLSTNLINYIQITVLPPKGNSATIIIYPSGRIQVN